MWSASTQTLSYAQACAHAYTLTITHSSSHIHTSQPAPWPCNHGGQWWRACQWENTHVHTQERHIQTDTHTHTNTGRPIGLLSSPPVVCSGFWLGPPFKGSAVVWTNKAAPQDGAITTGQARIFLLTSKEMFPWLSPSVLWMFSL